MLILKDIHFQNERLTPLFISGVIRPLFIGILCTQ